MIYNEEILVIPVILIVSLVICIKKCFESAFTKVSLSPFLRKSSFHFIKNKLLSVSSHSPHLCLFNNKFFYCVYKLIDCIYNAN